MKVEKIAAIGEIVSSVAILATLAYLAVQTEQNTQAIRATAIQGLAEQDMTNTNQLVDRIGFEVENLEAFCKELEAKGIKFDRPYSTLASGFGLAFLTDPWRTYIELTQGLRGL